MHTSANTTSKQKTRETICHGVGLGNFCGKVKSKALVEIEGTVKEKHGDAIQFCDLECDLFEGGTKNDKSKRDKCGGRRDWQQRTCKDIDAVLSSEISQGSLESMQ